MRATIKKVMIAILLCIVSIIAYAHSFVFNNRIAENKNKVEHSHIGPVSSLPVNKLLKIKWVFLYPADSVVKTEPITGVDEEAITDLAKMEEDYNKTINNPRAMIRLLRKMKVKKAFSNKRYKARLYNDLATISARLKMYPLAMQYHYQKLLLQNSDGNAVNTSVEVPTAAAEEDTSADFLINPSAITTDSTVISGTLKSSPVKADAIIASFNDGKEASEYALILHVKQPAPGKRKSFTGIDNVGHMFITLIKYNTDLSYVSRSFGFYPNKNNFIAATPFQPAAPPVLKDDAFHDWDEAIGKFISHKRFHRIIKILSRYEYKMYNLNQNNCTDFGLTIASLSGISISNTKGKWPLGKGNNPANAGQSILEGKIADEDTVDKTAAALFIFTSIHPFPASAF
jgi:hypothetical protein